MRPEVLLRPGAVVVLGMALHELAANAAAHGALSAPGGRERLRWSVGPIGSEEWLCLRWDEDGGPPVPGPPEKQGFGARLLQRGLAREPQAGTRLLFEPSGLRFEFEAPPSVVSGAHPDRR